MALSRQQDYWIHPNALSITLNYFGDPQQIQTSMLAGAVILAYEKNVITYDAAHNFREWQLQAYPTYLADTCKYYVHAELSRTGHTAMVIYSPTKRDLEGRTFIDGAWDTTTSDTSWFIYLGEISASVDANGASVERVWTDGLHTGTLATDQHRMEEAQGEWTQMFQLNSATGLIDFLKTVSSAVFNKLTIAKEFIFGGKTLTTVAGTTDTQDQSKVNDATLPTTGYVKKELDALDDHFLIKDDADTEQSVAGPVTFEKDVTVQGDHAVGGNQTIGGTQEVKGVQTLHQGFKTPNFNDAAGQFTGAQLTQAGLLSVAGLRAGYFEVFELIYNKIRAQGGKMVLSPAGVVENCSYQLTGNRGIVTPDEFYADDSSYTLNDIEWVNVTFKKDEFNNGLLLFEQGDILYGYVNQIGESGQYARGGQSCMYVVSSDDEIAESNKTKSMTLRAVLFLSEITDENGNPYDSSNVVAGNMAPTIGMSLAQRGNVDADKQERMTSFFIDSMTGNIIMLQNVMTPTIQSGHYGAILGRLPSDMYDKLHEYFAQLKPYDPALYVKHAFIENLVRVTQDGVPIPTEVYRGAWKKSIAEGAVIGEDIYRANASEYHTVTHDGSLWKCNVEGTTVEPSPNIAAWLLLVAKGSDSAVASYTIKPSANVVYFDTKTDKLSVDKITVTIGETTAKGYTEINSQDMLTERGLTLWYSVDGGKLHILNISEGGLFELEDGTGSLELENGASFMLEGEELLLSEIQDNVTIFLIDRDNVRRDLAVIPVMKAGSFKSTVFRRSLAPLSTEDTPTGGTYSSPIPTNKDENDVLLWSDGIPEGTAPIYSSYCTFYGDGTKSEWSEPVMMSDTADFEVIYSPLAFESVEAAREAIPDGFSKTGVEIDEDWLTRANEDGWYDDEFYPNDESSSDKSRFKALWMATNSRRQGTEWSDEGWVVSKIEGEDAYTLNISPAIATVQVNQFMNVYAKQSFTTSVELVRGGVVQSLKGKTISYELYGGETINKEITDDTYKYEFGYEISPANTSEKIDKQLDYAVSITDKSSGKKVTGTYSIAPVKLGPRGSDSIYVYMDNEMDSIALNADGTLEGNKSQTVSTTVAMYSGNVQLALLESPTVEAPENFSYSINKNEDDSYRIDITAEYVAGRVFSPTNVFKITLDAGEQRTSTFTLNGVKAGKGGAGAPLYRLISSDSAIHVTQDGSIDPSTISCDYTFTIGGVDRKGTSSDNADLFYIIDGGAEKAYTAAIQTSGISSYIKFILKANNEVQDVETVKVLRDGEDGEDGKDAPMTQNNLIANSNFEGFSNGAMSGWKIKVKSFSVKENEYNNQNCVRTRGDGLQTEAISSLDNMREYAFSVYVKLSTPDDFRVSFFAKSGISVATSDGSIVTNDSSSATVTFDVAAEVWTRVSVTISAEEYENFSIQFWTLNLSQFEISMPKLEEGEVVTPYIPAVADLTGPAGAAGVATFPLGDWMADVRYTRTPESTISVHYLKDGKYYRLKAEQAYGQDQSPDNSEYWEYITDLGAIYAEFIMANFAMFGSKRGGVFYDRYLFSQVGINAENKEEYFSGYRDNMFDKKGTDTDPQYVLNGSFIPNMFIDFLSGALKVTRFSEPFIVATEPVVKVNYEKNHNILIKHDIVEGQLHITNSNEFSWRNHLVLLPEYDETQWIEDGQHFSILMEHGGTMYGLAWPIFSAETPSISWKNIYTVVGVDDRILESNFSPSGYSTGEYEGNWFIWKGMRTKFVLLTPGIILKLRLYRNTSVVDGENTTVNYWHIENSSEFSIMNACVRIVEGNLNDGYVTESNTVSCKISSSPYEFQDISGVARNLSTDQHGFIPFVLAPSNTLGTYHSTQDDGIVIHIDSAKNGYDCSRAVRADDNFNT